MSNEKWKLISGFENRYYVSNSGKIKRVYKNGKQRIRKTFISTKGYEKLYFVVNGYRKQFSVHRLVGLAFIPNPENKPQINHKDGIKINNDVDNLEWATSSENVKHSFNIGLSCKKGEKHSRNKLTNKDIIDILKSKKTSLKLSKEYNISDVAICDVRNGFTWSHISGIKYKKKEYLSNENILDVFNSKLKWEVLANKYGISYSYVCSIKRGEHQSHITGKKYVRMFKKYSHEDIISIYNSTDSMSNLSKKYGFTVGYIGNIKKGRRLSHITNHGN